MAFLMFGASVGFSADFHFCQGEFKNFALFKKAKSCHELAEMKASCHMKSDEQKSCHAAKVRCNNEEEDGCCNNNTKLVQLDTDYAFGSVLIDNSSQTDIDIKAIGFKITDRSSIVYSKNKFLNYKPPLIIVEKTILYQSFLC